MIRIHKERLVELGILSKEYGLSRTQILDQLVQTAFQNMLGEVANHDTVAWIFRWSVETKNGTTKLSGVAYRWDKPTKNNRLYSESILESATSDLREKIKGGHCFGTLGHYAEGLAHDKISHVVESLRKSNADCCWHAKVKLLDTPAGRIAKTLSESANLGFSSRSVGNVTHHNGIDHVNEGMKILSLDLVGDPANGEFAKSLKESILNESFSESEKDLALKILAEEQYRHYSRMDEVARIISGKKNVLLERDLGIEALRRIPKYGDELARQQKRVQDQLWDHPSKELYAGHASFPVIDDDDRTYPQRAYDYTRAQLRKLSDLQDEIPIDKSQYPHMTVVDAQIVRPKKYLDFETDPIKRASIKKAIRNLEVSKAMVKRYSDYISRMKGVF